MRARSLVLPGVAALIVAGIAFAFAHGPGGSGGAHSKAASSGRTARITIRNYAFHAQMLTVRAGTTIMITNADQTAHTATANSGTFDTGTLNPGHSDQITLSKPGTYVYHCQFHAFMVGTIKVVR